MESCTVYLHHFLFEINLKLSSFGVGFIKKKKEMGFIKRQMFRSYISVHVCVLCHRLVGLILFVWKPLPDWDKNGAQN